ncbi:hypothetical protein M3193_05950 [Sporosarcina luteola]|uniref:hypothetical protein n=1 Tax=Sporosarcina luteola TaxID=582850 RepID=UPI002041E2D4|nr:hypothetical protein [Sporosarcina luteola]MCM3743678.1 hypothetical protein [Sporosarcina luteola]
MEKRRLIIGVIAILAIALYIWIAYFEIPEKVKIGEDAIQEEPLLTDIEMKGEVK